MAVLVVEITSVFKLVEKEEEVKKDQNLLSEAGDLDWGRLRSILGLEEMEAHPRTRGDGGPS